MRQEGQDSFREFAAGAIPTLRRTALGVCGDPHLADDLVQTALEKVYAAWPRVRRDTPLAYARTTLVRSLIDERRRWWARSVIVSAEPPDRAALDSSIER